MEHGSFRPTSNSNASPGITLGVLSILAGWFIPLLGLILAIPGAVYSERAIKYDENPGLGLTGGALSIIGAVISIIAWVYWAGAL